jgi:hypothetical protein
LLIIGEVIIYTYKKEEKNDSEMDRINRGWALISIWGLILLIHIIYLIYNIIMGIKEWCKKRKDK